MFVFTMIYVLFLTLFDSGLNAVRPFPSPSIIDTIGTVVRIVQALIGHQAKGKSIPFFLLLSAKADKDEFLMRFVSSSICS